MSAFDTFHEFLASMSDGEKASLDRFIRAQTADMLAARSEDARLRVMTNFVQEARERLRQTRRA